MIDETQTADRSGEYESDSDIAQKISDYIFLDARRYDGFAGDSL